MKARDGSGPFEGCVAPLDLPQRNTPEPAISIPEAPRQAAGALRRAQPCTARRQRSGIEAFSPAADCSGIAGPTAVMSDDGSDPVVRRVSQAINAGHGCTAPCASEPTSAITFLKIPHCRALPTRKRETALPCACPGRESRIGKVKRAGYGHL